MLTKVMLLIILYGLLCICFSLQKLNKASIDIIPA